VKWGFVLGYNVWTAHVFVTTLLGLFYFTERLQMSDGKAKVNRPDAPPGVEQQTRTVIVEPAI
jgi:hypothetical protein